MGKLWSRTWTGIHCHGQGCRSNMYQKPAYQHRIEGMTPQSLPLQSQRQVLTLRRWRYVDPSGQTQGPFPARNMLEWYRRGLLNDMSLQTCGTVRLQSCKHPPQT